MAKKTIEISEQDIEKFEKALKGDANLLMEIMTDDEELRKYQSWQRKSANAQRKSDQAKKALEKGNFVLKQTKDKLTITIDLKKAIGASGSGKSWSVASSFGNMDVDVNGVTHSLGLNFYRKPSTKAEIAECEAKKAEKAKK